MNILQTQTLWIHVQTRATGFLHYQLSKLGTVQDFLLVPTLCIPTSVVRLETGLGLEAIFTWSRLASPRLASASPQPRHSWSCFCLSHHSLGEDFKNQASWPWCSVTIILQPAWLIISKKKKHGAMYICPPIFLFLLWYNIIWCFGSTVLASDNVLSLLSLCLVFTPLVFVMCWSRFRRPCLDLSPPCCKPIRTIEAAIKMNINIQEFQFEPSEIQFKWTLDCWQRSTASTRYEVVPNSYDHKPRNTPQMSRQQVAADCVS